MIEIDGTGKGVGTSQSRDRFQADRRRAGWFQLVMALLLIPLAIGVVLIVRTRGHHDVQGAPPIKVTGLAEDRPVPPLPLLQSSGRSVSLATYRGRVVILAPVSTTCSGTCADTIAALQQVQHAVAAAGLAGKVTVLQVAVDPHRDTPARLRAFAQVTETTWPLLTGTPANLTRFWRFFGVSTQALPTARGTILRNWQNEQPLTHTLRYTPAVFVVGPGGHERIGTIGAAEATPSGPIQNLLRLEGTPHPALAKSGWTVSQLIGNVEAVLNQRIPR